MNNLWGFSKNSKNNKSSEFKKKNESHIINRKDDDKFANEESNDCSEEYFKLIEKYLLDAKYPDKIKNIKVTKKRNEAKSKFRKLVTNWRRFIIEKSKNKIELFKNLKFSQYDKIKTQMKKEEGRGKQFRNWSKWFFSGWRDFKSRQICKKKHGKTEEDLFEWKERPREWEKLEIIYEAHTKNKAHQKAYNTAKSIKWVDTFGIIWGLM